MRGQVWWPPSTVRNYHLMFRHIHPKTLEAVRRAKERGIWRVSREQGFEILRQLARELSGIYNIPTPRVVPGDHECYWIPFERIELPRVSLISFLHEFRHHMQKHGLQHYQDPEVDARAWSISVFYNALPEDFDRAWRNNRIWYMPPYPGGG